MKLAMRVVCLTIMMTLLVSGIALAERSGTLIGERTIIDGVPPNAQQILDAFVVPTSIQYISAITYHGDDVQLSVEMLPLQGFPAAGSAYVVMSTGRTADLPGQATDHFSTAVGGIEIPGGSPDGYDACDVATLTIELDLTGVSASQNPTLEFVFKFASEEVPGYLESKYQDYFTAYAYDLNGNFIGNVARLPDGNPFTIDNAWYLMNQVEGSSSSPLPPYPNPNDITMNGATDHRPVSFSLSSLAGQVCTIEFQIADVSDQWYDSVVFLDGLAITTSGGDDPDSNRVDLGVIVVHGDNVVSLDASGHRFRVEGNVHIDDVMRFSGNLEVNTLTKIITGDCRVWFEDPDKSSKFVMPEIDISDIAVQFFIDASQNPAVFRFTSQISELGFEVAGVKVLARELELYFNDPQHGFGFKADIYLAVGNIEGDPSDSGPGGSLAVDGFYATSNGGFWFSQAKLIVRNAKIGGGFGLDYLELTYEPGSPDRFAVDNVTVSIKHWDATVWGNLEIIGGDINAIGLGFESGFGIMIIPLPTPPSALYLQSLEAGISGLVTGDLEATGGIEFTYMPEIEVGGYTCHVVRCNVSGVIEEGHFNVKGTVSFLYDGWDSGGVSVDWWANQGVEINGFIDLGGIITGTLYAKISDQFRCRSSVQVDIPDDVWFIGKEPPMQVQLAWVDWTLGFKVELNDWLTMTVVMTPNPDSPYIDDCGFGKCYDVPFTPARICVNCGYDELLDDTYSAASALGYLRTKAPIIEHFTVAFGQAFVIARVEGEGGTIPYLELVDPTGNIITPALAIANTESYVYRANEGIGEAYIAVRNPVAGQWTIQVPGTLENEAAAKNGLSFLALSAPPAATIEITEPSVSVTTTNQVQFAWQGTSSTSTTDVSLFFSDTAGEAGALIADQLPVSGTFNWDVRGTAPGIYWIYGTINDGKNAEVVDFGPTTVTIDKDGPVAQIAGATSATVGANVSLDGSGSSDPWGSDLDFNWQFVDTPTGSGASLTLQEDPEHVVVVPDLPGTYVVELTVADPYGEVDVVQHEFSAVGEPGSIDVPAVATISFVGDVFGMFASVYDGAGNSISGVEMHFEVTAGPHVGEGTVFETDSAGRGGFSYTGSNDGVDTIQVWCGAETYATAPEALRSSIGHVWFPHGDCIPVSTSLVADGWHILSVPGQLCDPCTWVNGEVCGDLVCALEDDLDPMFAYRYDADLGGYYRVPPADQICYRSGMSTWIHTTEADTVLDAVVTPISGTVHLPLANGWNQIGNPYAFAISPSVFSIYVGAEEKTLTEAETAGWISTELYMYDTAVGNYTEIPLDAGYLPAWTGVWLKTFVDGCTLVINPLACTASGPMSRPLSASEILARGLELPPAPPELDVRTLRIDEILGTLAAVNIPNPVRSEHTTVFKVQGAGAEQVDEIRVDIYDQQGLCVFSEQVDEIELVWHTVNNAGELLANGIYLYQVWVRIGDIWYPMEVQKLAVVR